MAIGFAAKEPGKNKLRIDEIQQRAVQAGIFGETGFWSPEVHAAAFHLPPYIAKQLR